MWAGVVVVAVVAAVHVAAARACVCVRVCSFAPFHPISSSRSNARSRDAYHRLRLISGDVGGGGGGGVSGGGGAVCVGSVCVCVYASLLDRARDASRDRVARGGPVLGEHLGTFMCKTKPLGFSPHILAEGQ